MIKRIIFMWLFTVSGAWAGTYTAATCNYPDVNAVVNGPTHTAVNGDIIIIPAGTCTWTSQLAISAGFTVTGTGAANSTPSTFLPGTLSTIIVDNAGPSNPMFYVSGITYGQTVRISMLDIEPNSNSTALWSPISIAGTCTGSGCPLFRVDNIAFGVTTQWTESGNSSNAFSMIRQDNSFGVVDHTNLPSGSQVRLLDFNESAYLGVGAYGDNSWAQADTFGTQSAVYIENNTGNFNENYTDTEFAPEGGAIGGGRLVGRFNHLTLLSAFGAFQMHGLDTGGRNRSGRQIEAYGNTLNCTGGGCSGGPAGYRGGTGYVFGNTLSGSPYNSIIGITVYRTVYTDSPWGACGGLNSLDPWDTNDNVVFSPNGSGTATSVGGNNSTGWTLTDTTKSWTANQFVPNGAPYSIYDVTQGVNYVGEIASNTSNTITTQVPISESTWYTTGFTSGDSYEVIRSTVCADQAGRGAGGYVSGSSPSPSSALSQALDPIYEWDDTAATLYHGNFGNDTGRVIANRDYYTDNSNGTPQAQTSATSPFNGTSGVGFGTLAFRPTTCTARVGYFATDQGSWNTSGNGFGSGILYNCVSTNTWGTLYTPYAYPHPLTQTTGVSTHVTGVTMMGDVFQ